MSEISYNPPILKVTGRIDAVTSTDFEMAVTHLLTATKFLVFDLADCNFLSSTGIRILVKTHKKLLAEQGKLIIAGIQPEVYQIIEMVGLHTIFELVDTPELAAEAIKQLQSDSSEPILFTHDNKSFQWLETDKTKKPLLIWNPNEIIGCNELGFAIGYGASAEMDEVESLPPGLFINTGVCAGFLPDDTTIPADFRVASDASNIALFSLGAISFGELPSGIITSSKQELLMNELLVACKHIKKLKQNAEISLIVVLNNDTEHPSISIVLDADSGNNVMEPLEQIPLFHQQVILRAGADKPIGLTFKLETPPQSKTNLLSKFVTDTLTIDNIIGVEPLSTIEKMKQPIVWLFFKEGIINANTQGLQIETNNQFTLKPYQRFLIRKLYPKLSRVIVEPLHGGYSAQTFQVTSFDKQGRKLRPTVLKVANRAMITRESKHCQLYAQPYIFNNSAAVLGTEFQGDKGALVYNFVGIGGEDSRLKWLTHYFHQENIEMLESLFDKIFLQILKPWYGQPIHTTLYPFKDHDPTLTFFPHIYQTVSGLFSINADDQYIEIEEMERQMLNPYWFLKHEFPKRRENGYAYFEGICHGDLNMQNILLDESMNVYLIDFSETKPRSVISDFARLEAIFLVDNAPVDNREDLDAYLNYIMRFYMVESLQHIPAYTYSGRHQKQVQKQVALTLKMRKYALESVQGNPDILPYYMALLEWVLPIVCYYSLPELHKRLSMCISALLCENVQKFLSESNNK